MNKAEKAKVLLDKNSYEILEVESIYYPVMSSVVFDTMNENSITIASVELDIYIDNENGSPIDFSKKYALVEIGEDNG